MRWRASWRGAGRAVRVFEARTIGAGATQASAGILAPYIEGHDRGPLFDLTLRSLAMYDDFVARRDGGVRADVEYRRCGTLEVAADAATADAPSQRRATADAASRSGSTATAARGQEPALARLDRRRHPRAREHGYVAGPVADGGARVGRAASRRARSRPAHRVTGIRVSQDTRRRSPPTMARRGRRAHVVIAAGSWSGHLDVASTPRRARCVRSAASCCGCDGAAHPLSQSIWGTDCYVVPWADGTVLVGATVEDVGFDERTTAAGVRDLLDAVCELLPEAWRATFLEARAGLRPATPDGLPIIGPSPTHRARSSMPPATTATASCWRR